MSKLPKGWEKANLGNLAYVKNGYAFKSSFYTEKGNIVYVLINESMLEYINI